MVWSHGDSPAVPETPGELWWHTSEAEHTPVTHLPPASVVEKHSVLTLMLFIFVPQPRGPAQTATSPVIMATASRSGGSATARRSVPMALMNRRPRVVSFARPQFPPQHFQVGRSLGSQARVRGCSAPGPLGSGRLPVSRWLSVKLLCLSPTPTPGLLRFPVDSLSSCSTRS